MPFDRKEYYKNNKEELNIKHNIWYSKNKEKQIENTKRNRIKLRKYFAELLGNKCLKCGYNKFISILEFHHTKGKSRTEEKNNVGSKKFKERVKAGEIILLCPNCHKEEHYINGFPDQIEKIK